VNPAIYYPDGVVPAGDEITDSPQDVFPVNTLNGNAVPTVQSTSDDGFVG
jgi:hypothetical protein